MSETQTSALAARIVADLMPIAVAVAGADAAAMAQALEQAGAAAEVATAETAGVDLSLLLVPRGLAPAQAAAAVRALAAAGERILLVPWPPGAETAPDVEPWFELFAEEGFQPVVDYDASFLGAGAFLVDRDATAAEDELPGFVERISQGAPIAPPAEMPPDMPPDIRPGASPGPAPGKQAAAAEAEERARLAAALAQRDAELAEARAALDAARADAAAWQASCTAAEQEAENLRAQAAALANAAESWGRIGRFLRAWVHHPARRTLAQLRALRGLTPRRTLRDRLLRRPPQASPEERFLLREAALIAASDLFDAAWYAASQDALLESGADPLWHYVLQGGKEGADPGPWFDAQAYRAGHPEHDGTPLGHAIRSGALDQAATRSS